MANDPRLRTLGLQLSIVGVLLTTSVGCGKVPTWGELTGQAKPEAAPVVQPLAPPAVAPAVQAAPELPPPPDPTVVLQEFRALKPAQINDAALAKLGELTEGLDQITEIDARGGQVSPTGLAVVARLPNLKYINLEGTAIGDADVTLLSQAPSLESVRLNGANITDAGIEALRPLSNLRELVISRARLTRAGFAEVARHQSLERLVLDATPLDDESLGLLCGLKNLTFLSMSDTQVSDDGLMGLSKLNRLVSLEVGRSPNVHGEFLYKLGKAKSLPALRHLAIGGCPLKERTALGINQFKQLEYLRINYTNASDVHIAAMIKGMTKLKYLVINNNAGVTDEIFRVIGKLNSIEVLEVDNQPAVSDVGLSYLKGLKKLRYISAGNTSITPNGLFALRQFCPELDLQATTHPGHPFLLAKPGEVLSESPRRNDADPKPPVNEKPSGFIRPE